MRISKITSAIQISIFLSLFIVSCSKKLDLTPKQDIDASTAISTPDDVDAAVVGCYALMGGPALYGTSLFMDGDLLASSSYCSFVGTFNQFKEISSKAMNRDNTDVQRIWRNAYRTINMANIVLSSLSVVTDPAQKSQLEGEALFIRALMHFELVRFFALPWGATTANDHIGIVIKTTPSKNESDALQKLPRNTVAQVYTLIITDLISAIAKLPNDNGTRADKFTALSVLARVYLQQGDYVNALNAANSVIQSGKYSMNASVNAVFDNKNTNESIFEIQQNEQNNAGSNNDGMATFYASLGDGTGRGDVRVSSTFLSLYPAGDLRRFQWYYIGVGAKPGGNNCGKWKSPSQNLPVIRIAELLLIRAECNIRLNSTVGDTPANDLAKVRNPIRTNLPVIAAPVLSDILTERYLEFAFEGIRIHDVKRLKGNTGAFQWNNNKLVFPIPQSDVNASEGVIVQNPGY